MECLACGNRVDEGEQGCPQCGSALADRPLVGQPAGSPSGDASPELPTTFMGGWFLPFRDATSGQETYGARLYVDLETDQDGRFILDLNYAYNPFCAYDAQWVCPIRPEEIRLDVPVRAGELAFDESYANGFIASGAD